MLELKIYKNYRELCEELKWKIATGKQKQLQMEELSRMCKWHKEGNKIVIGEIYNTKKEKIDNRVNNGGNSTTNYSEIDDLLSHLLSKSSDTLNITLNNLLVNCGLVNTYNWRLKNNVDKLSAYYKVPVETISDFCNDTTIRAKSIVESALNRLVKKNVIEYKLGYMLVTINENGTKEHDLASEIEESEIEEISNNILIRLNCSDIKECYLKGKINEYYSLLDQQVRSNKIADNIYKAYSITIKNNVEQDNIDTKELKKSINKKFLRSCERSLKSRVSNAINNEKTSIYVENKRSDKYVKDSKKIIDLLVNIDTECVYDKVIENKDKYISIKNKIEGENKMKNNNNNTFVFTRNKDNKEDIETVDNIEIGDTEIPDYMKNMISTMRKNSKYCDTEMIVNDIFSDDDIKRDYSDNLSSINFTNEDIVLNTNNINESFDIADFIDDII